MPPAPNARLRVLRILLLLAVVTGVATLIFSGALNGFSLEKLAEVIRSYGPWGFLVYLLAFSLIQPFGGSGHMFAIAAAVVWPPWIAFPLALLGSLGSAMVNVGFVRVVAFDWVQSKIPPRVRKYEHWITERGIWGVVIFRFLTFTLHAAQLLIAMLRVPMPRMIVGTLIGFTPHIAIDVMLGGKAARWLADFFGFA